MPTITTRMVQLSVTGNAPVTYEDIFRGTPVTTTGSGDTATISLPDGSQVGDILFVFWAAESKFGAVSPYQMYGGDPLAYDQGVFILPGVGGWAEWYINGAYTYGETHSLNALGDGISTDDDRASECIGRVITSLDDITFTLGINQYGSVQTYYGTRPYDGEWIVCAVTVRGDIGYPFLGADYNRNDFFYTHSGFGMNHTGPSLNFSFGSLLMNFAVSSTPVTITHMEGFDELFDTQSSSFGLSAAWKYCPSFGTSGTYTATTDGNAYVAFGMFEVPKT